MRAAALLVLAAALASGSAAAQTRVVPGLGLGIDIGDNPYEVVFGSNSGRTTNLLVPVLVGPHVRLQPWVGYLRVSGSSSSQTSNSELRFRRITLGLSVHYLFAVREAVRIYLGGGFGYSWSKQESRTITNQPQPATFESKETRSDRTLNAVAGGEYFFAPRFSIGGEVRIDYITFGQPDVTQTITPPPPVPPVPIPQANTSLSLTQTNAQIAVRWYFSDVR